VSSSARSSRRCADAPDGSPRFRALPPPSDAEVERIVAALARRIARLLERRGLVDADPTDADDVERTAGPRCARVVGLSLHANVSVPARDRKRLERLCRYVARPPLASERYHGVRAPASPWLTVATRDRRAPPDAERRPGAPADLTPGRAPESRGGGSQQSAAPSLPPLPSANGRLLDRAHLTAPVATSRGISDPRSASLRPRDRRLSWAALMQRVFARDVLKCPACGGRMRLIAAIEQPSVIEAILRSHNLAARAPPIATARASELPLFPDRAFPNDDPEPDLQLDHPPPPSTD
jgi:hypothetical protein